MFPNIHYIIYALLNDGLVKKNAVSKMRGLRWSYTNWRCSCRNPKFLEKKAQLLFTSRKCRFSDEKLTYGQFLSKLQIYNIVKYLLMKPYQVEQTRPMLLLFRVMLPEKILLCMTGYLYWSPCGYKIPRDSSPVAFAELLQPKKKFPVLLFRPGHT